VTRFDGWTAFDHSTGSPTPPKDGLPLLEQVAPPIGVLDIEVGNALPCLAPPDLPGRPKAVLALVRLHTYPLGTVTLNIGPDGLLAGDVAEAVERRLGHEVAAHLQRDGLLGPYRLDPDGVVTGGPAGDVPRCLRRRAAILVGAPSVTVVVATRDRTASLARCLDSLLAVDYPRYQIVVVDNAPSNADTADLIAALYADRGVDYVREDRRGLATAHNRGIQVATGEILAFTDDDVVVDRHWLSAIAEGFAMVDGVAAVTGLIQPAELRTETQLLLERHAGYSKGFQPRVLDLDAYRPNDARFPLAAGQCGSGANMAFDAACLRRLGGFDPALGTGTLAKGGDDLAAFFRVVTGGHRLVYQPAALVRHCHRDDPAALANQAYGYGVGLGAYLAGALARRPRIVLKTAWRAPRALVASAQLSSCRNRQRYAGWSRDLTRLERRGVAIGPFAYAASRWQSRGAYRPE
jgi:GT2 family glycosyltransferase